MQLIKSIEIGYFRSIYKQKLDNLTDMTVLFGRNDSGKSNFLRALNLFFNGETNPDQTFNFNRDFNKARLSEPGQKHKFVYIKLTFTTPKSYLRSLGREFWVKKTWNISRGSTEVLEYSIKDLSNDKKKQFITKFLNQVKLHYIPAIKDRTIFENLLEQVYEVIAEDKEFNRSLTNFTKKLQQKTQDITKSLRAQIDIESVIAPPENLNDLFRSLDFETKNAAGDKQSLTLQKGDGIQMQHIPIILAFLSDKGRHEYNIWGFEEPENSLELANAVKEARAFIDHAGSNNKQVFITSHSPAFFSINDGLCNRFFISKRIKEGLTKQSSKAELIKPGDRPSQLMGETPLLPIISDYLVQAQNEIEEKQLEIDHRNQQIKESLSPVLFVEGESDRIIIDRCWEIYGLAEQNLSIISGGGVSKMKSLSQQGSVFQELSPGKPVFVLIDNDKDGRELYKYRRLKTGGGGTWVIHETNGSHWCRLKYTEDFSIKMKELGIPIESWPYTLENCFSQDIHKKAIEEGALAFDVIPHDELLFCGRSKKIAIRLAASDDHTYLRAPNWEYKVRFAEWVVDQSKNDSSILESFKPIIEGLSAILSENEE
jgi:predicted ATP-dependent endonuclease of OLD family